MDLSILIPARNEEFLAKTVEDLLFNIEANTEIIVVLDGQWANPPIQDDERVNIIYVAESIGQRAATNLACKIAKGKYVMKCDAHTSWDKGFDRKMLDGFKRSGDNTVMVPVMRNLHAFDWVCSCGQRQYQDKGNICENCRSEMTKELVWQPRPGTRNYTYCFDSEPHFQYFSDYKRRSIFDEQRKKNLLTETMSLQGSAFMCTREKYWELNICDEEMGSWGSQGIEVACKFWLSGGKVMTNHRTWYAHMFRTKPRNGFGFPYKQDESKIQAAKKKAKDIFFNNKWEKGVRPLSWLLERFWPVPGWTEEELKQLK